MPNITGHINTWVSPYEKKKHFHVLSLSEQKECWLWHWVQTTYVSFFMSSQKMKPRAKTYTEIPCWEDGKKETKFNNNRNIKSAWLIILDYVNQEARITNTWLYSLLVFHSVFIFNNTRELVLDFILVIGSGDLLKVSSGKWNFYLQA